MKRTLEDLFLDSVADLCHAEIQLTKAMPKIARAARDVELRQALEQHLVETEGHVYKLEEIFGTFGAKPRSGKCVAIAGIIKEAEEVVSVNKRSSVIDAAIIYAVQKLEHYEIATYGTLRAWARYLEKDGVADLIDEILDQEKYADERLTELAEMQCNESAISDERRYEGEYADWT
jgi:ferritin-like metal-binding protein YciE